MYFGRFPAGYLLRLLLFQCSGVGLSATSPRSDQTSNVIKLSDLAPGFPLLSLTQGVRTVYSVNEKVVTNKRIL